MSLSAPLAILLTSASGSPLGLPPAYPGGRMPLAMQAAVPEADETPVIADPPYVGEEAEPVGTSADDPLLEGRRRPGVPQRDLPDEVTQTNEGALRAPPPEAFPADEVPIPDRWRLIESLGLVKERWWDPYNQNTY